MELQTGDPGADEFADGTRSLTVSVTDEGVIFDTYELSRHVGTMSMTADEWFEYVAGQSSGQVGKHEHPHRHAEAGHEVKIWYPDWQVGYIRWDGDGPELYTSEGREAGDTDEAWCETCEINLNVELLGI